MSGKGDGILDPKGYGSRAELAQFMYNLLAPRSHPFVDVSDGSWYAEAVQYVYENHIMSGVDATHFAPNELTTRAMMAQVLYSLEGSPEIEHTVQFTDVSDDAWYADAIQWAAQNKLAVGYDDGTFGPMDLVTREQIATILHNYAQWKEIPDRDGEASLDTFQDADQISAWAKDSVLWAIKQNIIAGKGNGILDPKGYSSRAELAQVMFCLLQQ